MVTLGVHPTPTPAGVPVMMTVPAGRVVPCDKELISFPILKMRSLSPTSELRHECWNHFWRDVLGTAVLFDLAVLQTTDT